MPPPNHSPPNLSLSLSHTHTHQKVLEFLRICFSAAVIEGYGQTEGTCATSLTPTTQLNAQGNVGVPLPCNEVKLVDVPGLLPPSSVLLCALLSALCSPLCFHSFFAVCDVM